MNSVAVSLAKQSVTAGTRVQATAALTAADGSPLIGRTIDWSSSNLSVATVGSTGMITTLGAGTTTISGVSGGKSGAATLTVGAASQVSGSWNCPPTPQAYYVTMTLTEEVPGVVTGSGKLYFGTGTPTIMDLTISGSATGSSVSLTLSNGTDVSFTLSGLVTQGGLDAVLGGFVFFSGQATHFSR